MSGHTTAKDAPVWVLVEQGVVARYDSDGTIGALLHYGPITSDRVRGINMKRLTAIDPSTTALPNWKRATPPTEEMVTSAVAGFGTLTPTQFFDALQLTESRIRLKGFDQLTAVPGTFASVDAEQAAVAFTAQALAGHDFDSPNEFYEMVAWVVNAITPVVRSVTATLAEGMGVNENTARQYVYRARKRGLLPPSRKARA